MLENHMEHLWLVIPTSTRHNHLKDIFEASKISSERRILIRTSPGQDFPDAINLYQVNIFNIQSWWNTGIEYAASKGAKFVAVLNDDAQLKTGSLQVMLNQMVDEGTDLSHPDPKLNQGWGHCWILRVESKVRPDERFVWWHGDHDLQFQALRKGGVSISPIRVRNLYANELTSRDRKFEEIIKSDIRTFNQKYPFHALSQFALRGIQKILKIFQSS